MSRLNMRGFDLEYYACPDCGFTLDIWRKPGSCKNKNHLKFLFCINCNEEKNFVKKDSRDAIVLQRPRNYIKYPRKYDKSLF